MANQGFITRTNCLLKSSTNDPPSKKVFDID